MDNLSHDHWDIPYILDKYNDIPSWSSRFRSERYFFEKIGFSDMNVLDVGCAAGGLYHALKEKFGSVLYTGVDVSEKLLERGRELAPDISFVHGDIVSDTTSIVGSGTFDIAVATGVFQHDPRHRELIKSMLSSVKDGGYILFDVKLFHTHPTICDKDIAYGDHGDHKVYYIALHIRDMIALFLDENEVDLMSVYGYYTGAHSTVHLPDSVKEEVCSAHVLIRKGACVEGEPIGMELKLPEEFISCLASS